MNDIDIRVRILDEATRLFGRRGYGSTSVRELAEAAGVTKPTLYYWFQSKEGLFVAAVERQLETLRSLVHDVMELPADARERLEAFCARYVDDGAADPDGVRLLVAVEGPREDGRPEIDLLQIHTESLCAIQRLLADGVEQGLVRRDVDPTVASLALLGILNTHIMAVLHGLTLPEDLPKRLTRLFFHGVSS